ncbi:hypothetical protein ASZ78_005639 [Callipepla squamata]|uniref:Uncharacterized protein n=1 Tax=Callipepla squamata TaxID=9009 RepID=A0A226NHD9_CALSU|nr:hypothetical protein ASZ78_005639 [Callipepla squamata]
MFAKLKKKIAEEAAIAPRPGGAARIPRSGSKESITSVGADSGDDFIRNLQKIKEKLENALEKHQDSSMRRFQEQNEAHQANRAKMAEGMALALEKKDQEWMEKLSHVEKLLKKEESLSKAEQELEIRTQELIHAKEMLQEASTESSGLQKDLQELQQQFLELEAQRDELQTAERNAENKITALELREQELQAVIQQLSVDLQNMTFEFAERSKLIEHLQEKVSSLEKKLERNLSGDEHVQELLKEKASLEQKLDETSQQMLTDRMHHADAVSQLETQNRELEQKLQTATEALKTSREAACEQELKIQKLQMDLENERSKLQQQILSEKHQYEQKVSELESQIAALKTAWEFDKAAAQHKINQLEKENESLNGSRDESSLKKQESVLDRLKKELSSRETESVEIANTLEETQKQKDELQQQVSHLVSLMKEKDRLIDEKSGMLLKQKEELSQLSQDHEAALLQVHQLQSDVEASNSQAVEREEAARKEIDELKLQIQEFLLAREHEKNDSELEESAKASNEHLRLPENCVTEQNGEVTATDVIQLQKDNRELEQQIVEKNKKIRPDSEVPEVREKTNSEVPNASVTVTNNSDLNDSREINFEYLKHVVLKFMSCRESEMSWFGSKPSPRGSIRPSISSPRTLWS